VSVSPAREGRPPARTLSLAEREELSPSRPGEEVISTSIVRAGTLASNDAPRSRVEEASRRGDHRSSIAGPLRLEPPTIRPWASLRPSNRARAGVRRSCVESP
jgi:hypothetical protein